MVIDVTQAKGNSKADGSVTLKFKAKAVDGTLQAGQTYSVEIVIRDTNRRRVDVSSILDPEAVFTVKAGDDDHDDNHGDDNSSG